MKCRARSGKRSLKPAVAAAWARRSMPPAARLPAIVSADSMNARRDGFIGPDCESETKMRYRRLTHAILSLVIGSAGATYGQTNEREPPRRYVGGSVFLADLHAHRERRSPVATSSTS